jgi:glycerol-3-phosphate acyltransferase PlsY
VVATIITALFAVGAYLVGSIPTGVLLAARRGVDLRSRGSGNIGAANAARTLGRALGLLTFVGDAAKGFLPTWGAIRVGLSPTEVAIVGFAAFLGHLYPLYLGLRGGKGVATAAGLFLAIAPTATAVAIVVWIGLYAAWRIVSIASLGAALSFPAALVMLGAPRAHLACASATLIFIVWKHRGNIQRIAERREGKV